MTTRRAQRDTLISFGLHLQYEEGTVRTYSFLSVHISPHYYKEGTERTYLFLSVYIFNMRKAQ